MLYHIRMSATVPPELRLLWEKERASGYEVTIFGHTATIEGTNKPMSEVSRLEFLLQDSSDYHVTVKEMHNEQEANTEQTQSQANRQRQGL